MNIKKLSNAELQQQGIAIINELAARYLLCVVVTPEKQREYDQQTLCLEAAHSAHENGAGIDLVLCMNGQGPHE